MAVEAAMFVAGLIAGLGWRHFKRMRIDISPLPVVASGQSVTVTFVRGGKEVSNRVIHESELTDRLTRPKGGTAREHYRYSHVDGKGRFIYVEDL